MEIGLGNGHEVAFLFSWFLSVLLFSSFTRLKNPNFGSTTFDLLFLVFLSFWRQRTVISARKDFSQARCHFLGLLNSGSPMGARTSNRKRDDECLSLNRPFSSLHSPDFHLSKKPKLTAVQHAPDRRIVPSNSSVARLSRYPAETSQLRREVHAPCRTLKFGSFKSSNWHSGTKSGGIFERNDKADDMGNILSLKYKEAKSQAFGALRYSKKDEDVIIELDTETENNAVVSEDSSIEEISAMKVEELKDHSDVMDWSSRDVDGVVVNMPELDAKELDGQNRPSSSSMITETRNENERLEDAEKMLDDLSLAGDISSVSVYKKLLEQVERRTSKLMNLDFEIQLNEKRRAALHVERPEKKETEEVPREPFVPLSKEEEDEIGRAFSVNRRKVLITHENSNIEITGQILQCLGPGAWLNDEVINLYFELLKERENREPKKFLKCHFFNTFFYKKLISGRNGYDYKSVRRWTTQRKLGYELIDCDKIFVPIHKEIHWCLAVINKKEEKFQYLDSLKGVDSHVLKILARYLIDEAKDKSGKAIDVNSWEQEYVKELPEQENGFDCGVFMIKYADFYSRGLGLCFNQQHMPYFRLRTAKEILRLRAD